MSSLRYFRTSPSAGNGYPTSDGRPMAETDHHRKVMTYLIECLMAWYAARPDVYVTGNLLLFYERKNRRRHVSPDCFVAFGVPNHDRLNYLLWDEVAGPGVVIEVTSATTRREDVETKFALYRDVLRVPEYFQFDPYAEYLDPPLQGVRLIDGEYVRVEPTADGHLASERLGLHLRREGTWVRLWDPAARSDLKTDAMRAKEAAEREAAERQRAEAAEGELARLKAELDRLRRAGE
jgi:Uma2 family endonuclease